MKTFKQFLFEELDQHKDLVSVGSTAETPHIETTSYRHEDTGVNSFIHTDSSKGIAYWGYNINGSDKPMPRPEGMEDEEFKAHKKLTSDTSLEHLSDFARRNPNIKTITYQVDDSPQGESNERAYQKKFIPFMRENHGVNLVKVDSNPFGEG
jgi:hypothetical protein